MFPLDVRPGHRIGPFLIGMSLHQCIAELQSYARQVKRVDFLYDAQDPLSRDWALVLVDEEILLHFHCVSQRLISIEVRNVERTALSYANTIFSGLNSVPSLQNISHLFGPARPGSVEEVGDKHVFVFSYLGISFLFPIAEKFVQYIRNHQSKELPLELPDGSILICSTVKVYYQDNPRLPVLPPLPEDSIYMQSVVVEPSIGITLTKVGRGGTHICFGDSLQDILSDLGEPDQVFERKRGHLVIHSGLDSDPNAIDYFYNYFRYGIDVMFDGKGHFVRKIIMHTNLPGSSDFNVFACCNFTIPLIDIGIDEEEGSIDAFTHWSSIEKAIGGDEQRFLNVDSQSSSPFGGTFFYGHSNLIFEVMKNGYLSSVALFAPTETTDLFPLETYYPAGAAADTNESDTQPFSSVPTQRSVMDENYFSSSGLKDDHPV